MNSQSYFSSHQSGSTTSDNGGFPTNHRTNPHLRHQHLQQQQQQLYGSRPDLGTGTGTHVRQPSSVVGGAAATASGTPGGSEEHPEGGEGDGGSATRPLLHSSPQPPCGGATGYPDYQQFLGTPRSNNSLHPQQQQQQLTGVNPFQQQQQQQQPFQSQRTSSSFLHPGSQQQQVPHQHLQQLPLQHPQHQQQQRWFSGRASLEPASQGLLQTNGHSWMAQSSDRTIAANSKFPDSPPDSGSEPYSPPNDTRPSASDSSSSYVARASSVNTMATVMPSTHMFMDPRGPPQHPLHPGHGAPYHPPDHPHQVLAHQQQQQSTLHGPPSTLGPLPFAKGHFGFYGPMEPMKLTSDLSSRLVPMAMTVDHHELQSPYHSSGHNVSNQPPKKRKYSDSPPGTLTPGVLMSTLGVNSILPIKPEPCPPDLRYGLAPDCSEDDSFSYDYPADAGMFVDGMYQVIKWTVHQPTKWTTLLDDNRQELAGFNYRVDADKGFNFSPSDDAFVCQKKNHFQITVHVSVSTFPKYVRLPETSTIVPVEAFYLHFYGIKMESPAQTIKVEQSQSDRSKKLFNPVKIDLYGDQVHKLTVGRLHFSETTSNNMRKKGKPNPDQRYFQLVVALEAHCGNDEINHMVAAHASERIIVRASNPGQFETDSEVIWSKGKVPESIFHAGRVGVNTDTPDEALTVHGNVKVTGHVISPSDVRVKKDFSEMDTREQLKNISQLKVYKYTFKEDFAEFAGLSDDDRVDTGVLAQEVSQVLPDAVRETGDVLLPGGQKIDNFMVVNKDRIFIENVGAVKELCKVTDKLENRITEIELINKKLSKYSKSKKTGSVTSSGSSVCASGDSLSNSTLSRSMSNASSATNPTSQKHCTRHRHRHHKQWSRNGSVGPGAIGSEQQEQTACSGRLIQIVVIVLVVIMAICLLSITVLYVLDRKNLPQPIIAVDQQAQWQSSSSRNPATVPLATTGWPVSLRPPLIPSQCIESPVNCPLRCCGPATESPPDDPGHPPVITPLPPPISSSPKKPIKSTTTKSPNDVNDNGDDIDDIPEGRPPDEQPLLSSYSVIRATTTMGNSIDDLLPKSNLNDSMIPKRNNDINRTPKKVPPNARKRSKRDDVGGGLGSSQMALVYIKQLNSTLSSSYCVSSDCQLKSGSNHSYSVPVSHNFPALFVTLQFVPLATNPDVTVTLCNETENSLCSDSHDESNYVASRVSTFEWDLPVGFYVRLFVRFRLTLTPLNNVCELPSTDIGKSFAEYSIQFYRKCL